MNTKNLYRSLDAIKLALDSSYQLLSIEGGLLTEANVKSVNHTVSDANRMLREILTETLKNIEDE